MQQQSFFSEPEPTLTTQEDPSTMAIAPQRSEIGIRRHFTTAGVHPYDEVRWERRDARITNYRDGAVAFEQLGVEVPESWSVNATNILAQKYFRGTLGTEEREWSLKQVADRVADTLTAWGIKDGYFVDDEEAQVFNHELKYLIIHQQAAFNSPVWFNIGVHGVPQQGSACFILSVEDQMDSILNWYTEEGIIFKGGSGAGVNLSRIRSSHELLKGGGTASGPVSFMRGADASAGTIKSGGKTRRAAKMVILDADHPDVEDFIWCKAIEERKARVLRDAGFDMDLDGVDSHSTQYQNANNSVRVTDEFMQAVIDGDQWELRARTDGSVIRTVPARDLFRQIAHSAWECADPGLQYDTTINRWHTAPNTGRINGSNPCSEYVHLDNCACNLASMNLLTFLDDNDEFDVEGFKAAVAVFFTGQEIIVGNADYPTAKIGETTRAFRQLGIGYANLGALLMAQGLPYDSDAGRAWAAAITALLTGHAYATSARTAARMGPFAGYHENQRADAQRPAHAPGRGGPDRRGRRAAGPALGGPGGLGPGGRPGRGLRRAQLAGVGAGADRHHRAAHGLRHHRRRARPGPGQDQEAGRRRHHVDRQPDGAAGAGQAGLRARAGRRTSSPTSTSTCRSSARRTWPPST